MTIFLHSLRRSVRARQQGFSLIEMMIVVVIVGILTVTALTWGVNYAASNRVRKTAESLQAVLTLARNEAIKSNRPTTLVLAGLNWQIITTDPNNPIARIGSFTDTPNAATPNITFAPTGVTIGFNALGQATTGGQVFAVSSPAAACQPAGNIRCLNVNLVASGTSRVTDPQLVCATDPRGC